MSDIALAPVETSVHVIAPEPPLVPATKTDLAQVHDRLMEAIGTSEHYSPEFKAYETGRLSLSWLETLHGSDPRHVALIRNKGETVGFMISGPELGTLWLYWSYVFPEKRRSGAALQAMRSFVTLWDNDRFHKASTYTKLGNDAAIKVMERFGWTLTATLKQHIFGEDYLLYEHPLTKALPGYDHGVRTSRVALMKRGLRRLFGR